MRAYRDPFDATPDECAADMLDAFELEEVHARRWMRVPRWKRIVGSAVNMGVFGMRRRQHTRLAFRRPYNHSGYYVVMRHVETGRVLRLPFA